MKRGIKTGDEVVVISGNHRGERGKILQVLPIKQRVLVEGVNKRKHHEKRRSQEEESTIVERENPIHISNVMLVSRFDERQGRKAKA